MAVLAPISAFLFRGMGLRPGPILDAAIFGVAILAAVFLLLVQAIVALDCFASIRRRPLLCLSGGARRPGIAICPLRRRQYDWSEPHVGLAWPLMVLLHWAKDRHRATSLAPAKAVEIGFPPCKPYAFVILFRKRISLTDFAVLGIISPPMSGGSLTFFSKPEGESAFRRFRRQLAFTANVSFRQQD